MTAEQPVQVHAAEAVLDGDLALPDQVRGVVAFAHGSGSSRHSPRNRQVAATLQDAGFATLLLDLLTGDEEQVDLRTRELRFDIGLLAGRMSAATAWLADDERTAGLPIGLFGASTGAAAALVAAARDPAVRAVVSRGGRPDLAGPALSEVQAPTLLIVGGEDDVVIDLNQQALGQLANAELEIVEGAGHLFEEPGTLEEVSRLASEWFSRHLS
jgi:putative phosphoribosyl transferase